MTSFAERNEDPEIPRSARVFVIGRFDRAWLWLNERGISPSSKRVVRLRSAHSVKGLPIQANDIVLDVGGAASAPEIYQGLRALLAQSGRTLDDHLVVAW